MEIITRATRHKTKIATAKAMYFSLGILTHLLADMAFGWPGVAFFWPLTTRFWMFGYGAADYVTLHLSELSKERIVHLMKFALIDMAVGIIWIGYLFFKGKIKEFTDSFGF